MKIYLKDIHNPEIKEFNNLKESSRKNDGTFIAESEKIVLKLLHSQLNVIKVLCTEDFFTINENLLTNISCYVATKENLEKVIGHKFHHGVIALAKAPENTELKDLDNKILCMNGLTSPENVGTIVRTAVGLGINSILIDHKTVHPYTRRCVRVSMGNVFRAKIHKTNDITSSLKILQESHKVYATANEASSISINDLKFDKKAVIIIGSEGHGIDENVKIQADILTKIPMDETVAHLNAASCASIYLYKNSLF